MFSYEVGKPFGRGGPFQEGFELRMKGGPALLLFFRGLTPEETRGAREGRVWFGVAEEEGVLFADWVAATNIAQRAGSMGVGRSKPTRILRVSSVHRLPLESPRL